METNDRQLELVLFVFTLVSSIGFLSSTLLGQRFRWVGYGYAILYFTFSIVLGITVWRRRNESSKVKDLNPKSIIGNALPNKSEIKKN